MATHAGTTGNLGTGLEEGDGGIVVDRFGVGGFDDSDFVCDLCNVGELIRDPGTAFAVLFEAELGRSGGKGGLTRTHGRLALVRVDRLGHFLAGELHEGIIEHGTKRHGADARAGTREEVSTVDG
jgi:hypothetical protein